MKPYFDDGEVSVFVADCLDVMADLPDASVDAVVTDPPYGLAELSTVMVLKAIAAWMSGDRTHVPNGRGFMGREWDSFVPPPGVWDEAMRVLKPGGHLLSFAGSRTVDLMTLSIRIAGFEIRDSLAWLYSQGFPKSLDVGKAIDKAAGAQRAVIGERRGGAALSIGGANPRPWHARQAERDGAYDVTAAATEDAARWDGWGTALKPAHEPIIVARKPIAGTVAANVLEHGTGALSIAACRVDGIPPSVPQPSFNSPTGRTYNMKTGEGRNGEMSQETAGRWPPNVLLTHSADCEPIGTREVRANGHHPSVRGGSGYEGGLHGQSGLAERKSGTETVEAWRCAPDCPVAELDRQSGALASGQPAVRRLSGSDVNGNTGPAFGAESRPAGSQMIGYGDTGGASRFFPVFRYEAKAPASERPRLKDGTAHPTVKPLDLMRWLVRLVTPPGGLVLDPFGGSGTTAEACIIEGFRCILAEKDPAHAELIKARLSKPIQPDLFGGAA